MSTQPKHVVSPAARRQLNIAMSDLIAAKGSYEDEQLYYMALGKLTAQMSGAEPYESMIEQYKSINRVEEKDAGEPTTVAYFFGNIRDLRRGKWVLNRALELDYLPLCMRTDKNDKNCKDVYWSVKNVTKSAAWDVFNAHKDIFTQIDFLSDKNEAARAIKTAAKPGVKKIRAPKTVIQPTAEEMLASQVQEEKPTTSDIQSVEENTKMLDTQVTEEKPVIESEEEVIFKDESLEALLNNKEIVVTEQTIEVKEEEQSVEDMLGVH